VTEKQLRGFALLSPERRKEIASKGGKSVPPEKRYYADKSKASEAGAKGGKSPRHSKPTVIEA